MEKSNFFSNKQIIKGKKYISPSILSADFWNLEKDISVLSGLGCKTLHLDIMDGHFVPNISFGIPVVKSIRKYTDMILDAHLMVESPEFFAEKFIDAGVDMLSFHQEVGYHKDRLINYIKSKGVLCGIVLNPATPILELENILPLIDFVLLMSVNPGFGGQKFIPYVFDKVKKLNEMRKRENMDFLIEIDGGVNEYNIYKLFENGVDICVAGSSIFKGDVKKNFLKLSKFTDKF